MNIPLSKYSIRTRYEEKKTILTSLLQNQSTSDKQDLLQLYSALREAGDTVRDIIQSNVHDVSFRNIALSPTDAYSIGWVMAQQNVINKIDICGSPLTYAAATALQNGLGDSSVSKCNSAHNYGWRGEQGSWPDNGHFGPRKWGRGEDLLRYSQILLQLVKNMWIEVSDPDSLSVVGRIVQRHVDELLVWKGYDITCRTDIKRAEEGENKDEISCLKLFKYANATEIRALMAPFQRMKISRMDIEDFLMSDHVNETQKRLEFVHEAIKNCEVDNFIGKPDDLEKIDSELLRNIKKLEIRAGGYFEDLEKDDELKRRISFIGGIVSKCWPATYISMWMDDLIIADSVALKNALAGAKKLEIYELGSFERLKGDELKKTVSFICHIVKDYVTGVCLLMNNSDLRAVNPAAFNEHLSGAKMHSVTFSMWGYEGGYVESICLFLPIVSSEINLEGCELKPEETQRLQSELDKIDNVELKIVYGKFPCYKILQSKSSQKLGDISHSKSKNLKQAFVSKAMSHVANQLSIEAPLTSGRTGASGLGVIEEPRTTSIGTGKFETSEKSPMASHERQSQSSNDNESSEGVSESSAEDCCKVNEPQIQAVEVKPSTMQTEVQPASSVHIQESLNASDEDVSQTESFVQEHLINSSGCTVRIGDCEIIFPKNAVKEAVNILFGIGIPPKEQSKEYVAITAQLSVNYRGEFYRRVRVRLRTWCVVDRASNVEAVIIRESGGQWEEVDHRLLNDSRVIEFECTRFCRVHAAKRKKDEDVSYYISGLIYVNGPEIFLGVFPDDCTIKAACKEDFKEMGGKCKRCLNLFCAEMKDSIKYEFLLRKSNEFSVCPAFETVGIKHDFKETSPVKKYFEIQPSSTFNVKVCLTIYKNERELSENSTYSFRHSWRDDQDPQKEDREQAPGPSNVSRSETRASQNAMAAGGNMIFSLFSNVKDSS